MTRERVTGFLKNIFVDSQNGNDGRLGSSTGYFRVGYFGNAVTTKSRLRERRSPGFKKILAGLHSGQFVAVAGFAARERGLGICPERQIGVAKRFPGNEQFVTSPHSTDDTLGRIGHW